MKNVIIKKSNDPNIKYVIFSVTTESPLFFIDEIMGDVVLQNGQSILFDQLLQTGNSSNRFLNISFVNGTLDFSSITHLDRTCVEEDLYRIISDYLRDQHLLLHYSILLEEQKKFIMDGGNL